MRYVIGRLVKAVRAEHPWVFWNEVRDVERESRRLVAPYPFGETIPTVGGALLTWRTQPIDGVVSVAPRGCGPALIAEAQLRREAGLPALFVYADGDPIDEARLAGFAWRLRSRPARRARGRTGQGTRSLTLKFRVRLCPPAVRSARRPCRPAAPAVRPTPAGGAPSGSGS